jgi:ubiquinone/menaquinone biosynthesis C-methylase UbiE
MRFPSRSTNWKEFWQTYRLVTVKDDTDLLYQVGKTVGAKVITENQLKQMISDIDKRLELNPYDNIMDLCCGNGILTYLLAEKVKTVTGIDFSRPFIENAKKFKSRNNITYLNCDATELEECLFEKPFSKVLIYDALAYFTIGDLALVLRKLGKVTVPGAKYLFSSVLDKNRKGCFFDTPKRKLFHFINAQILGRNKGVGKWWTKAEISGLCDSVNLDCQFFEQHKTLHTAHYRMDVLVTKKD